MIITCEKCGKSFRLDDKLLKPGGTKLQCSKCKHIFRAYPPGADKEPVEKPTGIELITCEQCGAGFNMKSSLLKLEGSKVRCSKCRHIFVAFPSSAAEPAPPKEPPAVKKPAPAPEPEPEPELDFSLAGESADDLDLEIEESSAADEPSGASGDLELSLDEDDDDLDWDIEEESPETEPAGSSGDMELSLDDDDDDLELEIDEDEDMVEAEPSGAAGDLDLDLDEDAGGDLELDEDEDGDLELDTGDELEADEAEDPGDLELSLDDDSEELDFSEVDSLLDADDTSVADTVEVSADELDLNLGLDEDDEDAVGGVQQQEIDLADLEQTIEMELLEPEDESDEEPEDVELELADDDDDDDFDEEMALGEEEDISDIEEMLAVGEDEETIELDLEGDEEEEEEDAEAGEETVVTGKKEKKKKEKKTKAKKEKKTKEKKEIPEKEGKSRKGLIIALIIILILAALGAGGYWYVSTKGGISSLLGGEKAAPVRSGAPIVMDNTLQSDFIDNAKHGKLFIIKGSVKNESPEPKKFIKVVANLYSQGHKLEMSSSSYCGNLLTNEDLATRDLSAIDARLNVKVGDNNSNTNVKPGMTIPFMIVIPQLPENLVEYEVLVSESAPAVA